MSIHSQKRTPWLMLVIAAAFLALAFSRTPENAKAQQAPYPTVIYLFWGDGCPHCAAEKPFLSDLVNRYPGVEIRDYETWYNTANQQFFVNMAAAYGFEPSGVPTTFMGDRYWVGFNEQIALEIEAAAKACTETGCRDARVGIIPGIPTTAPAPIQSRFDE